MTQREASERLRMDSEAACRPVDEELVVSLVAEFLRQLESGESSPVDAYLARCPNEESRARFKELANMCQLVELCVREEQPSGS